MVQIFSTLTAGNLGSVVGWLILTYAAVLGACIIDLVSGIRKAIQRGEATTSTGLRKTCTKAQHYFLPMLCLSFADIMAAAFVSFPPFSMLWGAFCIVCEFKSVLEKSSTKKQIADAANTMSVVLKNKDDLAQMLLEVMEEMQEKGQACPPKKTRKKAVKAAAVVNETNE